MTGQFEAKKHGWRQTQDGIVVSFVVHPDDINAELAVAPLGTRYAIAFAGMGDDEKRVQTQPDKDKKEEPLPVVGARAWGDLPYVTQACIRCNERYFQQHLLVPDALEAARTVQRICGVDSRAQIVRGSVAGDKWEQIEADYQAELTSARYMETAR